VQQLIIVGAVIPTLLGCSVASILIHFAGLSR
jgi:hypothetical protein